MRGLSPGRAAALLGLALAAGLSYLNAGERVTVHLGLLILYRVPVSVLIFGAFLLGMLVMFLVGLRNDLRTRQLLRDRLARYER